MCLVCVYDLPQIMSERQKKAENGNVNGRRNRTKKERITACHICVGFSVFDNTRTRARTHAHTKWSWIRLMFDNINDSSGRNMHLSFIWPLLSPISVFVFIIVFLCLTFFFRWRMVLVSYVVHCSLKRCTKL